MLALLSAGEEVPAARSFALGGGGSAPPGLPGLRAGLRLAEKSPRETVVSQPVPMRAGKRG